MTPPAPGRPPGARRLTRRALLERWWVLPVAGTAGAFGFMGWYASRVTRGKRGVGEPDFQAAPALRVAPLSALRPDWAEVTFTYAGRPCTLLRVPEAAPGGLEAPGGVHLAAFSRVCTHLGCAVNLVRDPEVLAFAFNYRPPAGDRHPQLGCRCHYSVFDPLRGGEAVFGKANGPLPRVRLELRGSDVYATGIEAAPPLGT
ncbi:ubiquinol-cytochrome c reductase iron-sulfur subunit [Deinococcus hohokamensis]|uniref:Ubiquinol-cytochrome c reductase iron-sulfur subunit n=1 Tax=Deinococcus hohokamensis TaxID=309883 RepID=A0ABV9IB73_9DEIO